LYRVEVDGMTLSIFASSDDADTITFDADQGVPHGWASVWLQNRAGIPRRGVHLIECTVGRPLRFTVGTGEHVDTYISPQPVLSIVELPIFEQDGGR
jgi:hypothetical protein